jgi:hypothetical protein
MGHNSTIKYVVKKSEKFLHVYLARREKPVIKYASTDMIWKDTGCHIRVS